MSTTQTSLKNAKKRYTRLTEAEEILMEVYQRIGTYIDADTTVRLEQDIKSVLNMVLSYKHYEMSMVANLALELADEPKENERKGTTVELLRKVS